MGNVTLQFARGDFSAYLEKNIESLKERVYQNFKVRVVNILEEEFGSKFDSSEFTDFDSFYDRVHRFFINNDLHNIDKKDSSL